MLSSGSAQTLVDGIYLSHRSKKPEHLCDESHCRGKQYFQTEELIRSMSPVELHPTSQRFPSFPLHRHIAIVQIPITSSIIQCSWRFDLAFSLPSLCSLWFPNIYAPIGWPKRTVNSLSQAHLCLNLRPSCQFSWNVNYLKDASSFIKVVWCWPMILKGIGGLEWTGKERRKSRTAKYLDKWWQKSSFLRKPGSKLYNYTFSEAKLTPSTDKSQLDVKGFSKSEAHHYEPVTVQ